MGFYAPAQLIADARKHGVEVRPIDVNHSAWDSTLETGEGESLSLRLGLRMVRGLPEKAVERLRDHPLKFLRPEIERLKQSRRRSWPTRRTAAG